MLRPSNIKIYNIPDFLAVANVEKYWKAWHAWVQGYT